MKLRLAVLSTILVVTGLKGQAAEISTVEAQTQTPAVTTSGVTTSGDAASGSPSSTVESKSDGAIPSTNSQNETPLDVSLSNSPPGVSSDPNESAKPVTANMVPAATPPGKAIAPMAQVMLSYKQGKYRDALQQMTTIKPTELTHYYAGLCYQGLGQLGRAKAEFAYVASIARTPSVKQHAQLALRNVSNYASARTYAGQGNNFASVTRTRTNTTRSTEIIEEGGG